MALATAGQLPFGLRRPTASNLGNRRPSFGVSNEDGEAGLPELSLERVVNTSGLDLDSTIEY
jgi:hypothetical protein